MFRFLAYKLPPISFTRSISSWKIIRPRHPAFADLGAALTSLPRFRTRGEDIRVIYEPTEFYRTLLVSSDSRRGESRNRVETDERGRIVETNQNSQEENLH